jgi:hypothetical protein
MKFESLSGGIVKRKERRVQGLFIDGTGLDRATRRLKKKVDLTRLVRGVTSGVNPVVARYYTLIPYEDDSRQRAFLDAVYRAGLQVIVKRLPPKGVNRQVSVDTEMAADIVAFALGHTRFSNLSVYDPDEFQPQGSALPSAMPFSEQRAGREATKDSKPSPSGSNSSVSLQPPQNQGDEIIQRIVTVVCPSREISYSISLAKELGVDTATADFGKFTGGDILKSAAKWIDLSDSETIWRE